MRAQFRLLKTFLACMFFSLFLTSCYAGDSRLTIKHLGEKQSIVHINQPMKYLLLPVEEASGESRLNVMVDNDAVKTLNVRLAVNKVDYYVPLELATYAGKNLSLSIGQTPDQALCWNEMKLSDEYDSANREKFRPLYHFAPAYGWMNDPNGMVYKDGKYHLFYQYNPYGSMWGNMHWGHAVSEDLISWQHLPVAIAPDALGTIFSGSCVIDTANTAGFGTGAIVAFYTSAGERQSQSIAYSLDNGKTFKKYNLNPVLTSPLPDFRDPKVFWHADTQRWVMVLAAGQEMQIYNSVDLKEWTFESSFGQGQGAHGGVWECPDLIQLSVQGSNLKKWVLICNLNPGGPFGGSATQYFIGRFDGKRFINDSPTGPTKWMDWGKDHYAAVTWSNAPQGRHIAIAWMSNWEYANNVPTRQFRSSNSVPRELRLYTENGETYLSSTPVKEVEALRVKLEKEKAFKVDRAYNMGNLFASPCDTYEIIITLKNKGAKILGFRLFNTKGDEVDFCYNLLDRIFTIDRTKSGMTAFSKEFPAVTAAPLSVKDTYTLRLLVDKASIEAFDGEGRFAMTNLVFPDEAYNRLSFYSKGGKFNVTSVKVYKLGLK